jgi:chemotaxis regulatin CheY-phosphate phosphatase CheZ
MYIPFEQLPLESKIWIYQSNRKFSEEEVQAIETDLNLFLDSWESHGTGLESSYQIKYQRFIVIAVNQDVQVATGCSIDKSVQFIQQLEQKYQVELLDKMNVTYKTGEHIAHKTLLDFKKMAKEKAV